MDKVVKQVVLTVFACSMLASMALSQASAHRRTEAATPAVKSPFGAVVHTLFAAKTFSQVAISPNGNRFEFRSCRHPDCQMSDDEIASILSVAVKKPDWVLISADNRTSRWRTHDSSVFAYYFRNDAPWSKSTLAIGPDYALWVQTADVDASWRKYWAHLAENLRRNKRD